jgi:hypothetical protein
VAVVAVAAISFVAVYAVVLRAIDEREESSSDGGRAILDGRVADVIGRDYRDAQRRLAPLGARVLLALDRDGRQPVGMVTRTQPAVGEPVEPGADLVVFVAWEGPRRDGPPGLELDISSTLPQGRSVQESVARQRAGTGVWSTPTFPPANVIAGIASADPDDRCAAVGDRWGAVRFLNGELVGCIGEEFVWLDSLDNARRPIGMMPDLVNLTFEEALTQVRALGITGYTSFTNGTNSPAKVIATRPAAGEPYTRTTRVFFTLDGPPEPVR